MNIGNVPYLIHSVSKEESRLFHVWQSMNYRCNHKNDPSYKNYGGRGITIEWQSFIEFKNDMLASFAKHRSRYPHNTSIERKNVNGNYSKLNCCWATKQQQNKNRR